MKKSTKSAKKIPKLKYDEILSNTIRFEENMQDGIAKVNVNGKSITFRLMRISGIDIFNFLQDDTENAYDSFAAATISLTLPHKYVFTDCSPVLKSQRDFLEYRYKKASGYCKNIIQKEISRTKEFESTHRDKLAYLIVFGDGDKLIKETNGYMSAMNDVSVRPCEPDETVDFLVKYMCFDEDNRVIDTHHIFPEEIYDKQSYMKINNKYATSVVVSGYPALLKDLQLASLVSKFSHTITLDVDLKEKGSIINDLNQSLDELNSRGAITQSSGDIMDASTEYQKLATIRDSIVNGNEQMRFVTLRCLVAADTLEQLKDDLEELRKTFDEIGLKAYIPNNEMQLEYTNMLSPSNISDNPFPLHDTFSRQFPFYYQSIFDPQGVFWGYTTTGGLAYIDTFYKTFNRESYDLLITGKKGSGKTIALKKMIEFSVSLGDKVFVLDVESEYHSSAAVLGGQVIKMNKNSIINVLQLMKSIDKTAEEDDAAAFATNYASELSRIITFFYQYMPSMSEKEEDKLKDILGELYLSFDITEDTDVTKLSPDSFPVMSDLLDTLRSKLYERPGVYRKELNENQISCLESLETMIKPLAEGIYSSLFNGYTNVSIDDRNLIIFDVKALSEMEERVYNAQLFNILSIMWSETCMNVQYNNSILHPFDRRHVISVIDEAHRFINRKNINVTKYTEKLTRRSRKYDAGLWFASQSAMDFSPPGDDEGSVTVGTIFDLVQYKIIMKQSISDKNINRLHEMFPQFTAAELLSVKKFQSGEMLLAMGDDREKIHCLRCVEAVDLMYMGNSYDRQKIIRNLFISMYNQYPEAEYARLIRQNYSHFVEVFTDEVLSYLSVDKNSTDDYCNIVRYEVEKLAQSYIRIASKA